MKSAYKSILWRNWKSFRLQWKSEIIWMIVEPALLIYVFGKGLSQWTGSLQGQDYFDFFSASILGQVSFIIALHEGLYGVRAKNVNSGVYNFWIHSGITAQQIFKGEMFWICCKAMLGVSICLFLLLFSQSYHLADYLWIYLICLLISISGGCVGIYLALRFKADLPNWFSIYLFPFLLVSGIFIPVQFFPLPISWFLEILPLAAGCDAIRAWTKSHELIWMIKPSILLVTFAAATYHFTQKKISQL